MKAYLVTTGILFGLLAALHAWRIVAGWDGLNANVWFTAGPGVISAGLSLWAWILLARSSRAGTALS